MQTFNYRKEETDKQRKKRVQREKEEEDKIVFDYDEDDDASFDPQSIDSNFCHQMKTRAINNDQCPMCFKGWHEFEANTIGAILPCRHACCVKCLQKHLNESSDASVEEKDRRLFRCPLCNLKLSKRIFNGVALAFVSRNLIDSFRIYGNILEFANERFQMLVVELLLKYEFDLNRVENSLWNMACLVDTNEEELSTSNVKQKFYEVARAPVLALRREIITLKTKLYRAKGDEALLLEKEMIELRKRENEAKLNASNDLFERVNTSRSSKSVVKKSGHQMYSVDFHGLHVGEAKAKVNELIMPILDVVRQIEIVCGRGIHSQSGVSVLKVELKKFFIKKNIKCLDLPHNDGAFIVHN